MRARFFLALAFGASIIAAGVGCTAFIAAELSSDQGSDSGSDTNTVSSDCFQLVSNQCGSCIESNCEKPNASPPVSLKAVCSLDQYGAIVNTVQSCVQDPRFADYNCQNLFVDGGAYASSIDNAPAAENNLQKCINDNCKSSCSECDVPVPTCEEQTINLAEAGACGTCLDNAMNRPNAQCQTYVLQGACYEDPSGAIGTCAPPSGTCTTPDCSGLKTPDTSLDDAGYAFFSCLWQECQGSCPNP
jgi:hypothetical protein